MTTMEKLRAEVGRAHAADPAVRDALLAALDLADAGHDWFTDTEECHFCELEPESDDDDSEDEPKPKHQEECFLRAFDVAAARVNT